jgi:general secretion pathway protein K
VTAVVAMALLALMALSLLRLSAGHTAGVAAEYARARLRAAADAGFFYAVRQLSLVERERRWSIDGRPHPLRFDGIDLAVAVEDERGKVPLNSLDEEQARRLFALLGIDGEALDALTDAFLDWRDPDGDVRPHGAERDYYAASGRVPRNGPLRSLGELLGIRGMTPALVDRLRPVATVFGGEDQGFDERYAQPFALRVMAASDVTVLERERELAGERPALPLNDADRLTARALTIRVMARDAVGDRYARATVIQFTGRPDPPFLVRMTD